MQTITNEIKAKYYNQYQFSHVCFEGISNSIWTVGVCVAFGYYIINGDYGKIYMQNVSPLLLTSLEKISDKDSVEIAKLYGNEQLYHDSVDNLVKQGKHIINCFLNGTARLDGICYQYLQSKGYAMPYQNYSVYDLVELNIIKLKK